MSLSNFTDVTPIGAYCNAMKVLEDALKQDERGVAETSRTTFAHQLRRISRAMARSVKSLWSTVSTIRRRTRYAQPLGTS